MFVDFRLHPSQTAYVQSVKSVPRLREVQRGQRPSLERGCVRHVLAYCGRGELRAMLCPMPGCRASDAEVHACAGLGSPAGQREAIVVLSLSSGARAPLPPLEAALHRWPRPLRAASPFALDQLEEQPRGLLCTKSRPFGHRIASDQRGRLCIRLAGQSPSLQPGSRMCFRLNIPRSTTPKPTRQAVIDMSSFGRSVFSLREPRKMTEDQGTVP